LENIPIPAQYLMQLGITGLSEKNLSIVQARVVGLAHFTVGYVLTYAAFLIASTASRYG
jgi:Photosystem I psaA/psaB protein